MSQSAEQKPIRVKFMAKKLRPATTAAWRRQLPDAAPRLGDCEFVFDPDCVDYDWLVAYDDLSPLGEEKFSERVEELACPRKQTILVTAEPSSIKCYSAEFCRQFDLVITHHEPWAISHPNIIYTQTGYPWFYGRGDSHLLTYDAIAANHPSRKTGMISTVCSAKRGRKALHQARFDFTEWLAEQLPEMVRYGRGIRPLNDKAEVLDGYRYHVTCENDSAPHYFTEKLVDSFLGLSLPFYYGCPNAADYFPERSFIPIDIFDFEGSLRTITEAVDSNQFEQRLPDIEEARRRVLEDYNLFALLAREISVRHDPGLKASQGIVVRSRRAMRNSSAAVFIGTALQKYRLKYQVARRRRRG